MMLLSTQKVIKTSADDVIIYTGRKTHTIKTSADDVIIYTGRKTQKPIALHLNSKAVVCKLHVLIIIRASLAKFATENDAFEDF